MRCPQCNAVALEYHCITPDGKIDKVLIHPFGTCTVNDGIEISVVDVEAQRRFQLALAAQKQEVNKEWGFGK